MNNWNLGMNRSFDLRVKTIRKTYSKDLRVQSAYQINRSNNEIKKQEKSM